MHSAFRKHKNEHLSQKRRSYRLLTMERLIRSLLGAGAKSPGNSEERASSLASPLTVSKDKSSGM